ncbi:MAG: hypothetical protein ACI9EW_000457 [Cellvibrionaceae bacterium]|jgi:hypothetical protein
MNTLLNAEQSRILPRVLFCLLPLLAIISLAFGVNAAPIDSNSVDVQVQNLNASNTDLNITVAVSPTLYLPIIWGPPLPAPSQVRVSRPVQNGANYTWNLTWNFTNEPTGASYTIFESNSPDMNPILSTYSSTTRSKVISHPPGIKNTFYYAVKLKDLNTKTSAPIKQVSAYRDDFNTPSGWAIRRQDFDDTQNVMSYVDGRLKMHVQGRWDYFITSPLAETPAPPYRISTRVKFDGPGNLNTYGIIFGGDNNGGACPTIFPPTGRAAASDDNAQAEYDVLPIGVRAPVQSYDIANVNDNCLNYYFRMMFLWKDGFGKMLAELKEIYYHDDNNSGRGQALFGDGFLDWNVSSDSANDWNDWAIEVYPNGELKIFSGLVRVGEIQTDKSFLINGTAFGLWASTDEYPGSDPLYEYILVEPIN